MATATTETVEAKRAALDAERSRRAIRTMAEAWQLPAYRMESILHATQSANYAYERSARGVVTRLMLRPPDQHGQQRLQKCDIRFAPLSQATHHSRDRFGNPIIEAHHERVFENLTIVVEIGVENSAVYDAQERVLPTPIPASHTDIFREPSALTAPDSELVRVARMIRERTGEDPFHLFFALAEYVYKEMRFISGSTGVKTTAAEAWAGRSGVCQDLAHIILTLCRICQMPARYVSGFLPGEGAMHAWVETLLPAPDGKEAWYALDPTHYRWVNERYVTVAVGRDYLDIAPTSGTYYGGGSHLRHHSRVLVESSKRIPIGEMKEGDG